MSAKTQALAVRQLADEALSRSVEGQSAADASKNFSSVVNGAPLGPSPVVTFSTALTPHTGGALSIQGTISGTGTADQLVTAVLKVNGVTIRTMTVEIGSTTFAWGASLSAIDDNGGAGFPSGTSVAVSISASAISALTVPAGQASLVVQEVTLT